MRDPSMVHLYSVRNPEKKQGLQIPLLSAYWQFCLSVVEKGKKSYTYLSRYRMLKSVSLLLGALIIVLCAQSATLAQLADSAESEMETLFGDLFGTGNGFIGYFFGGMRLLMWGGILVTGVGGAYQGSRGSSWEPWAAGFLGLILMWVLIEGAAKLIFGY